MLEVGNSVQAVFGTRSDQLKEEMQRVIAEGVYTASDEPDEAAALTSRADASPAPVPPSVAPATVRSASPALIPDPASAAPGLPADFTLPLAGRVLPLSEVPDPVFSGKIMGDGFAIDPVSGEVRSPVSGEVITGTLRGCPGFQTGAPSNGAI